MEVYRRQVSLGRSSEGCSQTRSTTAHPNVAMTSSMTVMTSTAPPWW